MADHKIIVSVPGVEKLLDMVSSGVGAVAASWLMRRDAAAQADSIRLIAQAQADARKIHETGGAVTDFQADMTIAESVQAGMQFQAEKQMGNVAAVVHEAKDILGDAKVPDKPVDHDFAAHFFDGVKNVSSERLRSIWAALLAGEIKAPGQSSLRTLSVLTNLRPAEVETFNRLGRYVILGEEGHDAFIFDCFLWSLIGELMNARQFRKNDISGGEHLQMMEAGLLMSNWTVMTPKGFPMLLWGDCCGIKFASSFMNEQAAKNPPQIPIIPLTQAGLEIARCGTFSLDEDYLACFAGYLRERGWRLQRSKGIQKRIGADGKEYGVENWETISDKRK